MTITIYKSKDSMYDVFVDNIWMVSRGAPDNIMSWLADWTAQHGPAAIVFTDKTIPA